MGEAIELGKKERGKGRMADSIFLALASIRKGRIGNMESKGVLGLQVESKSVWQNPSKYLVYNKN